ncbi:MAG: RNA ligase family protein [Hyphomicrobiales bacterium]
MLKYPRTPHLAGSRLQPGDEDLTQVPFRELASHHLVVEEKVDGSNAGISFGADGGLLLQSRGHFLRGGPRERQFDLMKAWAGCHEAALRELLGTRYVMYGEWAFAKHTIFYDALPHYFLEFDMLDRETGDFLSTRRRRAMLEGSAVRSVSVLEEGRFRTANDLHALVGKSLHKSAGWRDALARVARGADQDMERVSRETDPSDDMEGLYIKLEDDDRVVGRVKFIRTSFLTNVIRSETHWLDRPLLQNGLQPGVDIFAQGR